jgi:hypothetical protein
LKTGGQPTKPTGGNGKVIRGVVAEKLFRFVDCFRKSGLAALIKPGGIGLFIKIDELTCLISPVFLKGGDNIFLAPRGRATTLGHDNQGQGKNQQHQRCRACHALHGIPPW